MDSFKSFLFRQAYRDVEKLGDRLAEADGRLDWEAFRSIVAGIFCNGSEYGGRPNVDEVVMVKLLVLQQWIGRSLDR